MHTEKVTGIQQCEQATPSMYYTICSQHIENEQKPVQSKRKSRAMGNRRPEFQISELEFR